MRWAVEFVFKEHLLNPKYGVLKSAEEIQAVGHRVLHGGMKVTKSCLITDEVVDVIKECAVLGPLHNPANLKGIMAVKELLPTVPQVAWHVNCLPPRASTIRLIRLEPV